LRAFAAVKHTKREATMRAAVFEQTGAPLGIASVRDPTPGPHDLIVRVAYSGVCGTDLHLTQSGMDTFLPPGMILGHEFCGEVVDVGREAKAAWRGGERVTVMPFRACSACGAVCKDGLDIICPNVTYLGIAAPGGNAEFVAVGAAQAIRLPEAAPLRTAALCEPLAVGLHAVRKARGLLGQRVLVIGGGPVGLAVSAFAGLSGAASVIVSEPHRVRRDLALGMGATGTIDPGAGPVGETFRAMTGGPPDVVFECVGTPGMIAASIAEARLFGEVIVVGACMEQDHFHPMQALQKEVSLRFALGHDRTDFAFVVQCLAEGRIAAETMITGEVGFDAFPAAFEALRSAKEACKVLLRPH
jgi:(R,R)-butanediol dehydrogenase/meso-butanediol dehydrogenase/diacetyl reductase